MSGLLVLVIIMAIFIVVMMITVGIVIKKLYDAKKKQEASNFKLWNKLNEKDVEIDQLDEDKIKLTREVAYLRNRHDMVGVSYMTQNKDIQSIINDVKNILERSQYEACPSLRQQFSKNRQSYIDSLKLTPTPVKCSELKQQLKAQLALITVSMSEQGSQLPSVTLQTQFEQLIEKIITIVCVNDTLDVDKVDKLLQGIIDAVCSPTAS